MRDPYKITYTVLAQTKYDAIYQAVKMLRATVRFKDVADVEYVGNDYWKVELDVWEEK
jgi:hypothetical protein